MDLNKQFVTDLLVVKVRESPLSLDKMTEATNARCCSWYQPKGTVL
jgi:hypothetical protein